MKESITAVLLATSISWGITALAKNNLDEPTTPSTAHSSPVAPKGDEIQVEEPKFKDTELQKFAELQKPIQAIRTNYSRRLQSAKKPEEAAKLQKEATDRMVKVVKDSGLDVQTYNKIAVTLQSDRELQAKVNSLMK